MFPREYGSSLDEEKTGEEPCLCIYLSSIGVPTAKPQSVMPFRGPNGENQLKYEKKP